MYFFHYIILFFIEIWEYIEGVRETVEDLAERVRKAQHNTEIIIEIMKKWEKDPLFTRVDDGSKEVR